AVYNNIFLHENKSRGSMCVAKDCLEDWRCNHNLVTDRFTTDRGTTVMSMQKWRSLTRNDADSNSATARTLFVDAANRDFHLRAGGPAVAAGTPYRTPDADLEGKARPRAQPDIGAFQLSGEGQTAVSKRSDHDCPQLIHMSPAGSVLPPLDHIRLQFSEELRRESLDEKTLALTGPDGPISIAAIEQIQPANYRITFAAQSKLGRYVLSLTPGIADLAGNPLSQIGNDPTQLNKNVRFLAGLQLVSSHRFCFGTRTSATAEDCVHVAETTGYSPYRGYGWLNGGIRSVDNGDGPASTRSLDYGPDMLFAVDLPGGDYDVTLTMGNSKFAHDKMAVFLQDSERDQVNTAVGQFHTRSYRVTVADQQLKLELRDLGGSDPNAVINSLVVGPASSLKDDALEQERK
ncbi:MAG TPA: Ig-like domain-containing protein, partial [Planctomycetaceae bacterium]